MTANATLDAIVQRMLLGTERAATQVMPKRDGELASALALVDASDAERALLASAAIASAYDLAGRLPFRSAQTPRALPAVVDAEDSAEAPQRVGQFLTIMLGGVNSEVLREWLQLVTERGWRVPSPLLPQLLETGRTAPYLRRVILPALGARGRWLAARNDDWSYASGIASFDEVAAREVWQTGTPTERAEVLTLARANNATFGRALLESTWSDEAPSQRATLLARFEEGLSLDDELFLEGALDDRRQEVRRTAADLLCHLAGSALVARMTLRARAALAWRPGRLLKKAEIVVEPPLSLDAEMTRDGLATKTVHGVGERAVWLTQIVGAVPPRVWSDTWNATPGALISAAAAGDWGQTLTEAWGLASVVHRDAAFAEALLESGFPGDRPTALAPSVEALLTVLSVERRETLVTEALRIDPASERTLTLLTAADHRWSEPFARGVLEWLRKRLASVSTLGGPLEWRLRELIPRLALRIPPMLPGVTDNWPTTEDAASLAKALDRFINLLTFRRALAEELDR